MKTVSRGRFSQRSFELATIERDEGRIRLAKPGQCNFFVTTAYYALNCPAFGLYRGGKVAKEGVRPFN